MLPGKNDDRERTGDAIDVDITASETREKPGQVEGAQAMSEGGLVAPYNLDRRFDEEGKVAAENNFILNLREVARFSILLEF